MMESTFEIFVDGKSVFTWKGDQEAVEHIFEAFPGAAEHAGMTERQFADNCVHLLIEQGHIMSDSAGQEMQMMAILWRVLEAETGNPDHPGRIASYVGAADFTVDLHETKIEGDLVEVKFNIIVSPQGAGLA
jgi:hypothetical protein